MACFNSTRPLDRADENERKVFRYLSKLVGDWFIVWGYHYTNASGEICEGDFLILGPQGGLIVLEVKGREHLLVTADGRWNGESSENPFFQLDAQWQAVMEAINSQRTGRDALTVVRALAVPNIQRAALVNLPQATESGALILAQEDLADFAHTWDRTFGIPRFRNLYPNTPSRQLFLDSRWGLRFTTNPDALIRSHLDAEIDRFSRSRFVVLDHLPTYQRFAISGAAGTGKTWLLVELALRWAGRDDTTGHGRNVLLLCYNKPLESALEGFVRRMAGKGRLGQRLADHIRVLSWESVVQDCLATIGERVEPPHDPVQRDKYFSEEIPAALELALAGNRIAPAYDALVVDEAQDHDTISGKLPVGWWSVYRALLRAPETAPIAVAYDAGQRSRFSHPERFKAETMLGWLGPQTVNIRCPFPVRYTPRLTIFLAEEAQRIGLPFPPPPEIAPDDPFAGPPVEKYATDQAGLVKQLDMVVDRWITAGTATADEILVIGMRSDLGKQLLPPTLAQKCLVDHLVRKRDEIGYISAGRCKGLESQAVIVVGFEPFEALDEGYRHSFFLAVSRARQRLAIINVEPPATPQAPADAPAPASHA